MYVGTNNKLVPSHFQDKQVNLLQDDRNISSLTRKNMHLELVESSFMPLLLLATYFHYDVDSSSTNS